MDNPAKALEETFKKKAVAAVQSGDTVRVHQKIREGGKERIQVFEGLVIRTSRPNSLTASFTARRIASGVGVEKTYMLHAPNILKVEIIKRSKVRRNYLSYMRQRTGKRARLSGMEFDREAVNAAAETAVEEEEKIHEAAAEAHEAEAAKKSEEEAATEAKVQEVLAKHDETVIEKTEADKIEEQPQEKADAKGPATSQNIGK